jgi:heme-degrading monooxygenase HmoA
MPMRIAFYAVTSQDDERFRAAWKPVGQATLHRALRDDVDFRFVAVAEGESASHRPLYEVVHEDGTPEGAGGVVLIDPFAVPAGADAEFLDGWNAVREAVADRHGYLGTRLYRAVEPADFRFVNVARWSSPLMFARASGRPEFRAAAAAMRFASHPALYTVVAVKPGRP